MQKKNKVGRPPRPMPEPIPDTPENVAKALLNSAPQPLEEWGYLKEEKERTEETRQGSAKFRTQ